MKSRIFFIAAAMLLVLAVVIVVDTADVAIAKHSSQPGQPGWAPLQEPPGWANKPIIAKHSSQGQPGWAPLQEPPGWSNGPQGVAYKESTSGEPPGWSHVNPGQGGSTAPGPKV